MDDEQGHRVLKHPKGGSGRSSVCGGGEVEGIGQFWGPSNSGSGFRQAAEGTPEGEQGQ